MLLYPNQGRVRGGYGEENIIEELRCEMVKDEVLKLCKKADRLGFITHAKILDIYDVGEEVPGFVVDFIIERPQRRNPIMIMGEDSYCRFNDLVAEYWEKHIKK